MSALVQAARLHGSLGVVLQMPCLVNCYPNCAACAMAKVLLCRWTSLSLLAHTQQRLQSTSSSVTRSALQQLWKIPASQRWSIIASRAATDDHHVTNAELQAV